MKTYRLLAIAAVAAAMMGAALVSQAAPVFAAKISDGVNSTTIFDGGVGDSAGVDGIISYTGNNVFGNWTVSFVLGTSTLNPLEMHMTSAFSAVTGNFTAGESKVLTISLSQTGLSSGVGSNVVVFGAHGGGSGSGGTTSAWTAYADDSDALFGTGTNVFSSTGFTTAAGGINASMTDTYSATLVATFDVSASTGMFAAGSQDLTMRVPEPATIALAGLSLLALGAIRRRKA